MWMRWSQSGNLFELNTLRFQDAIKTLKGNWWIRLYPFAGFNVVIVETWVFSYQTLVNLCRVQSITSSIFVKLSSSDGTSIITSERISKHLASTVVFNLLQRMFNLFNLPSPFVLCDTKGPLENGNIYELHTDTHTHMDVYMWTHGSKQSKRT